MFENRRGCFYCPEKFSSLEKVRNNRKLLIALCCSKIVGGVKSLKHKQVADKYVPLISKEFMEQAEYIVSKAMLLEQQLAETPDTEMQRKYDHLLQQLEELIDPPSDENEENE